MMTPAEHLKTLCEVKGWNLRFVEKAPTLERWEGAFGYSLRTGVRSGMSGACTNLDVQCHKLLADLKSKGMGGGIAADPVEGSLHRLRGLAHHKGWEFEITPNRVDLDADPGVQAIVEMTDPATGVRIGLEFVDGDTAEDAAQFMLQQLHDLGFDVVVPDPTCV